MRALVPMTLAMAIGFTGLNRAVLADELVRVVLDQIDSAHKQNYEALERAPVRHWGRLNQLRPWTDLRHALVNPGRSAESRTGSARNAAERFNLIYAEFVEQLQLVPEADLLVDGEEGISTVPQLVECTAFVDVPTALVLRVKPKDWAKPIVIASGDEAELEIEGQTLTPVGSVTLYAVLPLTASGTPGRRKLALQVSSAGRQAKIPLVIDVKQSGRLTGTVHKTDGGTIDNHPSQRDRTPELTAMDIVASRQALTFVPMAQTFVITGSSV